MPRITEIVDSYIAAWNETDPERRRMLVERSFSEDASYVDPLMSGEGVERIDAMIAAAQQQFPGHRFSLAAAPMPTTTVSASAGHSLSTAASRSPAASISQWSPSTAAYAP